MRNDKIIQDIEEYILYNKEHEIVLRRIQNRIKELSQQLEEDFSLVFMAEKGAGKTTTIDFLLGLTYENKKVNEKTKKSYMVEEDVLETGSGATTTSEVIVCQSDDLVSKIAVESYTKEEVLDIINTFSKIIFANAHGKETNEQIAPELLRACRNMSGLTEKKTAEERIDQAIELAKKYSEENFDLFAKDIILRCNIDARVSGEYVYDGVGTEREWLKKTFRKINLVHLPDAPLPKRITVKLSQLIFDFSQFNGIKRIVDTRGLELGSNTDRNDIKNIFKSGENNVILFVDKFNSPSKSIIDLLDHYVYDHDMDIVERIGYVVNFRDGEPIKVVGCDGVVGDESEGILEKRNQAIQIFKDNDVKIKEENIIYCNPRRNLDEMGKIKLSYEELEEYDFEKDVITKIKKDERIEERTIFVDNIIGFVDDYQERLNQELEKVIASFNEIKETMQESALLDTTKAIEIVENDPIKIEIGEKAEEIFDEYIGNKFPSTLSAINNRYGIYSNNDIYCEGANVIEDLFRSKFKSLKDKAIIALKMSVKTENHKNELKFLVKDINNFLFKYIENANEYFYNELKNEVFSKEKEKEFWMTVQRRWGKGAGYRKDVLQEYKRRLQQAKIREILEDDINGLIEDYTTGLINILKSDLDK